MFISSIKRKLSSKPMIFLLGMLLTLVLFAGVAYAQTTDPIMACVTRNGSVRIVWNTGACKSNESPLTWNIQGQPGPQGEKGDTGDTGPQGEQGLPGVDGEDGLPGDQGAQGEQGIQGPRGLQGIQGIQGVQGVPGVLGFYINHSESVDVPPATIERIYAYCDTGDSATGGGWTMGGSVTSLNLFQMYPVAGYYGFGAYNSGTGSLSVTAYVVCADTTP
jgi:hypothetical protein